MDSGMGTGTEVLGLGFVGPGLRRGDLNVVFVDPGLSMRKSGIGTRVLRLTFVDLSSGVRALVMDTGGLRLSLHGFGLECRRLKHRHRSPGLDQDEPRHWHRGHYLGLNIFG